jgi:hypothetical protein
MRNSLRRGKTGARLKSAFEKGLRRGNKNWLGLGAPGDLYRYIPESLRPLVLIEKKKSWRCVQVGFLLVE